MTENRITIKISPEVLLLNDNVISYSGGTAGVFSSMTQMLSGGNGGTSLFTGMTIPISLLQTIEDLGYYSTWDGNIIQENVLNNFIYSASSLDSTHRTICMYNTSDIVLNTFLLNQNSSYQIYWGDGSVIENFNLFTPNNLCHVYNTDGVYTVVVTAINIWGTTEMIKDIVIPLDQNPISTNPDGTIIFDISTGSWSATPSSYDYIYNYDGVNLVDAQVSIPNFITEAFGITGYTYSRLNDLSRYGNNSFGLGPIFLGDEQIGSIDCNPCFDNSTGYTIGSGATDSMVFFDYPNGDTIYSASSRGLISEWLLEEPIIKEEFLLKISMQPEVQSNIFIERGKNSVYERIQRIGEVDNLGDLEKYGYGFFRVIKIK